MSVGSKVMFRCSDWIVTVTDVWPALSSAIPVSGW